jgi:hypothetical protein
MRPNTLAEAVERIQTGSAQDIVLAEFVDTFDLAKTDGDRFASIEREPKLTGDVRLDALVGAIAEYLAKQRRLGRVPPLGFRSGAPFGQSMVYNGLANGCDA